MHRSRAVVELAFQLSVDLNSAVCSPCWPCLPLWRRVNSVGRWTPSETWLTCCRECRVAGAKWMHGLYMRQSCKKCRKAIQVIPWLLVSGTYPRWLEEIVFIVNVTSMFRLGTWQERLKLDLKIVESDEQLQGDCWCSNVLKNSHYSKPKQLAKAAVWL